MSHERGEENNYSLEGKAETRSWETWRSGTITRSPELMSEYGGDPGQMRDDNGKLGDPENAILCGAGGNPRELQKKTKNGRREMGDGNGYGNGVGWPSPPLKKDRTELT